MKKKIYKYVSVAVIAVAMMVSFQMSKANSTTNLTMENIEALAMADGEGSWGYHCNDEVCIVFDAKNKWGGLLAGCKRKVDHTCTVKSTEWPHL